MDAWAYRFFGLEAYNWYQTHDLNGNSRPLLHSLGRQLKCVSLVIAEKFLPSLIKPMTLRVNSNPFTCLTQARALGLMVLDVGATGLIAWGADTISTTNSLDVVVGSFIGAKSITNLWVNLALGKMERQR